MDGIGHTPPDEHSHRQPRQLIRGPGAWRLPVRGVLLDLSVGTRLFRDAQVYLHQGLLGTPSQGLGIVGRFAVGRGRMMTFVVIIG